MRHRRALGIREKALGTEHPGVATGLNNLAEYFHKQVKVTIGFRYYKGAGLRTYGAVCHRGSLVHYNQVYSTRNTLLTLEMPQAYNDVLHIRRSVYNL